MAVMAAFRSRGRTSIERLVLHVEIGQNREIDPVVEAGMRVA